jgi:hypothetical protein
MQENKSGKLVVAIIASVTSVLPNGQLLRIPALAVKAGLMSFDGNMSHPHQEDLQIFRPPQQFLEKWLLKNNVNKSINGLSLRIQTLKNGLKIWYA